MKELSKELRALDRRLYKLGRQVEILERLKWPVAVKKRFLKDWRKGRAHLPRVIQPRYKLSKEKDAFREIVTACKGKDPLSRILKETARSYLDSLRMLEGIEKKRFLEYSAKIYGLPKDHFEVTSRSIYRTASQLLHNTRKFNLHEIMPPESYCIRPEHVASKISRVARKKFGEDQIEVKVDRRLPAKASAGPSRIRVRAETCFASHDIDQLIEHELLVHTLTLQNGRRQKLKTLGLSSPRISTAQEGLAVFAEFITNSMDVTRLLRISARVKAIQMGIDGADFIDVFEFFLAQGQSEEEAYYSSMRVFRGGKVSGGVVFTKDLIYFKGFVEVHHFFLQSLRDENFLFPHYFFAGRMCTEDVPKLAPYFESGLLKSPKFEPDWVRNRSTLLAFLLSSSLMNSLGMSRV